MSLGKSDHAPLVASEASATVARLEAAGHTGDAAAWAELATMYLRGDLLDRDLLRARLMLRRAVTIGHVDAALLEIALTANGSGGAPDWQAAVRLLQKAAGNDPLAAQHLDLLKRMAIDEDGVPRTSATYHRLHSAPSIQRIPNFCTPEEAAHIASLVVHNLEPATVFDPTTGALVAHPIRNSDNAVIGPTRETLVVQAINRRIAAVTETKVHHGEPLTILRYAPGQQYKAHLDTLSNTANQRVKTVLIYLNDGYSGGKTTFPLLPITVDAKAGDALVFDNVDSVGQPEPLSRHAGLPVERGTKWLATRWIRHHPIDPWKMGQQA